MTRLDHRLSAFEKIADQVLAADTVAAAIVDIRSAYDLAHVTYHLVHTFSDDADSPYVRTTYPLEWVGEYVLRRYVDKDPVIRAGTSRVAPFNWDDLSSDPYYDEVMDAAQKLGVGRSGYSVPIVDKRWRRALISLNSRHQASEWRDQVTLFAKEWITLASLVHRKAVFEAYGQEDPLPRLAPREVECLTWAARGRGLKETALLMNVSEYTVRAYLRSGRHKLGSATLTQAVSKAIKYHIISL